MDIRYSYCGDIPADINFIKLRPSELRTALQELQNNLSQVTKVTLEVGSQIVYIYHEKCSGWKRASKDNIQTYDEATRFACAVPRERKHDYTKLFNQIQKLLN